MPLDRYGVLRRDPAPPLPRPAGRPGPLVHVNVRWTTSATAPMRLAVRAAGPRRMRVVLDLVRSHGLTSGSHLDAAGALEPILVPGRHVLVFGEPFRTGLGMHDVHQNQGDPAGSQWWDENGTWQDGATLTGRPDGAFDVFLSKFSTQSGLTDDAGHPVP